MTLIHLGSRASLIDETRERGPPLCEEDTARGLLRQMVCVVATRPAEV